DKLKNDVHALVAFDGKLPNPRELALFKDDTLLVVLPNQAGGAGYWGVTEAVAPPALAPSFPAPSRPGSLIPPAPVVPGRTTPPARPSTPQPPGDIPPGIEQGDLPVSPA